MLINLSHRTTRQATRPATNRTTRRATHRTTNSNSNQETNKIGRRENFLNAENKSYQKELRKLIQDIQDAKSPRSCATLCVPPDIVAFVGQRWSTVGRTRVFALRPTLRRLSGKDGAVARPTYSTLYTSVGGSSFLPGCRNPASKDGKLWDTTDALVSTDGKIRLGNLPGSSTCATDWLPSMAWISASMPK